MSTQAMTSSSSSAQGSANAPSSLFDHLNANANATNGFRFLMDALDQFEQRTEKKFSGDLPRGILPLFVLGHEHVKNFFGNDAATTLFAPWVGSTPQHFLASRANAAFLLCLVLKLARLSNKKKIRLAERLLASDTNKGFGDMVRAALAASLTNGQIREMKPELKRFIKLLPEHHDEIVEAAAEQLTKILGDPLVDTLASLCRPDIAEYTRNYIKDNFLDAKKGPLVRKLAQCVTGGNLNNKTATAVTHPGLTDEVKRFFAWAVKFVRVSGSTGTAKQGFPQFNDSSTKRKIGDTVNKKTKKAGGNKATDYPVPVVAKAVTKKARKAKRATILRYVQDGTGDINAALTRLVRKKGSEEALLDIFHLLNGVNITHKIPLRHLLDEDTRDSLIGGGDEMIDRLNEIIA